MIMDVKSDKKHESSMMDSHIQMPSPYTQIEGSLWPSDEYDRQVAHLRNSVGQKIYLVEVRPGDFYLTVSFSDKTVTLLDVFDYPKPDPARRLYPHMILLDDGRGVNLGRIARITVNQAFNPSEKNVMYKENYLMQQLMYRERSLSAESILHVSKMHLAKILGKKPELAIRKQRTD